jgi:hypothetical protein
VTTLSNYTTQVRNIVENCSVDNLDLSNNERIEIGRKFIFDFEYPIWTEEYRKILETKIIKHFYTKEIGLETVGLWKFYLEERLNLIMPIYNKLYATTIKDYDYLTNFKTDESMINNKTNTKTSDSNLSDTTTNATESTQSDTGDGTQTIDETGSSKLIKSDTPQANYNGLDYASELNDNTDSRNNTVTTNNNNTTTVNKSDEINSTKHITNTDTITDTESYSKTTQGNNGSKSFTNLIIEYRESLINIDKMIIDELQDLFMSIY